MSVKLLTELHWQFLSLKGGCTGSSESRRVLEIRCGGSNHIQIRMYMSESISLFPTSFLNLMPKPHFQVLIIYGPVLKKPAHENLVLTAVTHRCSGKAHVSLHIC